jgi:hypothetical protein
MVGMVTDQTPSLFLVSVWVSPIFIQLPFNATVEAVFENSRKVTLLLVEISGETIVIPVRRAISWALVFITEKAKTNKITRE